MTFRRPLLLSMVVAALSLAAAARGDDTPKGDDTKTAGSSDPAPRVRASHRVDVIAPGEKVESVIDRMRADRTSAPLGEPKGASPPPPVRGPDRRDDRGARERLQAPSSPMPVPGGAMPTRDSVPPDRPRR